MNNADPLQIKIEEAKAQLSKETLDAINSVDWRGVLSDMVGKKNYSIDQLDDLETETELLLCGLITPANYPRELESRMGISHAQAMELVNEMNEKVFKKIRDKLIENTERKAPAEKTKEPSAVKIADIPQAENGEKLESREEILARLEQPEIAAPHPILAQKLAGPMQIPSSKTIHSLDNLSRPTETLDKTSEAKPMAKKYEVDPYREVPE